MAHLSTGMGVRYEFLMTVSRHPIGATAQIAAPGDGLCLDFVNTLFWRGTESPTEELTGFQPLLGWLEAKSGHDGKILESAKTWSAREPAKADMLLAEAIRLREAIHRIFAAAASGQPLPATDFEIVNRALEKAPARRKLAPSKGSWEIPWSAVSAPALLAPVLWSAADLILSRNRKRIRQCSNEKCLYLFIDESKNGTRRWCDMSSCGNRAKAHRHLLRKKQG
jgi:predicted RNA-binding Zn ribbon-like protein